MTKDIFVENTFSTLDVNFTHAKKKNNTQLFWSTAAHVCVLVIYSCNQQSTIFYFVWGKGFRADKKIIYKSCQAVSGRCSGLSNGCMGGLPLLCASSWEGELTATLQSEQYSRRLAFSSSVSISASVSFSVSPSTPVSASPVAWASGVSGFGGAGPAGVSAIPSSPASSGTGLGSSPEPVVTLAHGGKGGKATDAGVGGTDAERPPSTKHKIRNAKM